MHSVRPLSVIVLVAVIALGVAPGASGAASPEPPASPGASTSPQASASPGSSVVPSLSPTSSPVPAPAWEQTLGSMQPLGQLTDVTTWAGGFAAIGVDANGDPRAWISEKGDSWTSAPFPLGPQREPGLGAVGDRLVAVAIVRHGSSQHLAAWTSADGVDWTRAPDGPELRLPGQSQAGCLRLGEPFELSGTLVVHGYCDGCCGATAAPIAAAGPHALLVRAAKEPAGAYAWTTRDGRTWTRHPVRAPVPDVGCIVADGERLLSLEYASPLIDSTDGIHWHPIGDVPILQGPPGGACVLPTAEGYVQVGESIGEAGAASGVGAATSVDGVTWTPVTLLAGLDEVESALAVGGAILVDGYRHESDTDEPVPAQLISLDNGHTWAPTSGWPSTTIAANDTTMVAVGQGAWTAPLFYGA